MEKSKEDLERYKNDYEEFYKKMTPEEAEIHKIVLKQERSNRRKILSKWRIKRVINKLNRYIILF